MVTEAGTFCCVVENALTYNSHVSIFIELLNVEFKYFPDYFIQLRIGIFSCYLEIIELITVTYNRL